MTFAHPEWLWLLAILPLLGWWEWRQLRAGGPALRYSSFRLLHAASPTWRVRLRWVPRALRSGMLALAIFALARPQVQNEVVERSTQGIDIMIVLDTSTSMRAQDFPPNRFEAARDVAADFIRSRNSDRLGLIVFAGKAFTQVPLTTDYSFLLRMMDELEIGVVEDGTAIGNALATAVNGLKNSDAESKIVILLTDGQNNRGEIDPGTAAELARAMAIRIYAVGVGSTDPTGEPGTTFDETASGALNIDEESLREMAVNTDGQYFLASNRSALREVYREIDTLEKTDIEEVRYTDFGERYVVFLWPAVALLLLEVVLSFSVLRIWP
ncbi:MAG: vWA domain-containing protein [Bacteroidota bacterium]